MVEKIPLERIIRQRTWMSFVVAFPEGFEAQEKQACVSLFDTSDRVRFTPISPAHEFSYHISNTQRQMDFTIQDTFRRDGYMFVKHLFEKASRGGQHAIGYGYPRIGLDILCIETTTDNVGTMITDAYLLQNAIPTELSQSQNEDTVLDVTMSGFFASNNKVMILADNYIKAQIAAQQQKEEAKETNVVNIHENPEAA